MIQFSDCDKCVNYTGLDPETKQMTCKAFPKGIPLEYVFHEINVREIEACKNEFKFEDKNRPE